MFSAPYALRRPSPHRFFAGTEPRSTEKNHSSKLSMSVAANVSPSTEAEAEAVKVPLGWFLFDAECPGSSGADLTLTFEDGGVLYAHSHLLAMLSPVLKTAVEECEHFSTLSVESDNKTAWILLLNMLHPAKSLTVSRDLDASCLPLLTCIAGLVKKYAVTHVHEFLDDLVSEFISKKKNEISTARRSSQRDYESEYYGSRSHHPTVPSLTKNDVVCSYVVFAARYEMKKTLAACIAYLAHIFVTIPRFSCRVGRSDYETGPVLANLVKRLSDEGFPQEGCQIAGEIVKLLGPS